LTNQMRFVSLCGMMGYGYPEESLRRSLAAEPAFIGVDGGSTDPGPYYLGEGVAFVSKFQMLRDTEPVLLATREHHIPFIIGTAGGAGALSHVESYVEVVKEIAAKHNLHFRLAIIPADISREDVLDALNAGRIMPCGPSGNLTDETIKKTSRIVAQMGAGPFRAALEQGADVVIAGRSCDTAIFAAMPLQKGFDPGLVFHAAKIAEDGALCARPAGTNDSLICTLGENHFVVEPANPTRRCTPDSVVMLSLYEQADPRYIIQPEGYVDVSACSFQQEGEGSVRVEGSRFVRASTPTLKLEGVQLRGYRSISVGGARDPMLIEHIDEFESLVSATVASNLPRDILQEDYSLRILKYGIDGVTGNRVPVSRPLPGEIGIVLEVVAINQELADYILALARATALHQHFPGRKTSAGNIAFAFSPSDFRGGRVYEFSIYHLMETENPDRFFSVQIEEI
jgi:hypothetical protein